MKVKPILISDIVSAVLFLLFVVALPTELFKSPTSYVIEASNGDLLSASTASDGQWRFPMPDTVPEKFVKCITTFEDQRFFLHFGVDPVAMARAMKQNLVRQSIVSGGSTLTMQVIRLSRGKQRTLWQKLTEMLLAVRFELSYSKNEIIKIYATNAPFGSNVVGLEAASWRYYGRKPENLSWGEMATLAVLPNSPSLVHPGKNADRLIRKRNDLLDKLVAFGIIDSGTAALSKLEPIPHQPYALPQNAPHLLSRFKSERQKLEIESTRLTSTLDVNLQTKLNQLLKRYHNRYKANGINNIAVLVLDVRSGTVKSYVGNCYQPDQPELESYVDMISAPRSPGSTLKPFLYASMLNEGMILPHSLVADVPTQIAGYTPQNYDLGYDGAIPADKALSRSLNIPAVKLLQQYKYERFYDKLKKLGFTTLNQSANHYGLSLILGGSEVTMWDLATAYMGMARTLNHFNNYEGNYNAEDYSVPNYVKVKRPTQKKMILKNSIYDHGAIWATFNAMEEVMRPGDEGLWEQFSSAERIAWKTGTSFGFRDAWAIGLTSDYVICVWVGNADGEGRPGLVGVEVAAPVLFDIFRELPSSTWFKMPKTKLKTLLLCKQSGFKAGEYCTDKISEFVLPTAERSSVCPYHKLIHLDVTGKYRVTDQCESVQQMVHRSWFVLPPTMEYYYKIKNMDYKPLPAFKAGCDETETNGVMEMIYPKNRAIVYIPVELDGERGKVIFNAAHRRTNTKIYWHIDDTYVGTTKSFHQLALAPGPGKHLLTLVDENGERLVQTFEVLARAQN